MERAVSPTEPTATHPAGGGSRCWQGQGLLQKAEVNDSILAACERSAYATKLQDTGTHTSRGGIATRVRMVGVLLCHVLSSAGAPGNSSGD